MTQHTPGPWKKKGRDIIAPSPRSTNSHLLVASVYETAMMIDEPDHVDADAALISAAPDLLEALLWCKSALEDLGCTVSQKVLDDIAKAEAQS